MDHGNVSNRKSRHQPLCHPKVHKWRVNLLWCAPWKFSQLSYGVATVYRIVERVTSYYSKEVAFDLQYHRGKHVFFSLCHQLPTALLCLTSGCKPKLKVLKEEGSLCREKTGTRFFIWSWGNGLLMISNGNLEKQKRRWKDWAEIVGVIHDCKCVLVIFRKINDIIYLSLSV